MFYTCQIPMYPLKIYHSHGQWQSSGWFTLLFQLRWIIAGYSFLKNRGETPAFKITNDHKSSKFLSLSCPILCLSFDDVMNISWLRSRNPVAPYKYREGQQKSPGANWASQLLIPISHMGKTSLQCLGPTLGHIALKVLHFDQYGLKFLGLAMSGQVSSPCLLDLFK